MLEYVGLGRLVLVTLIGYMLLFTIPSYTRYQVYLPHCYLTDHRPTLHYSPSALRYRILPSRLYPTPYHHILSIPFIPHVSLAFTYYSILPYHTRPYPTLNYFTLSLLKLTTMTRGRNDAGRKRLVLLGQIDLPSGDKAETTRRK